MFDNNQTGYIYFHCNVYKTSDGYLSMSKISEFQDVKKPMRSQCKIID